ncbi:ATP-binding cassette domain-containing protein [bacterium]|nr:ATP-binding cassette domain-containing protein [bacterium]
MISVKNLYKNYSGKYALNGISFDVSKGQILGFLGPNGAGKTTTMRIISGFLAPTSGKVFINGMDVFKHPLEIKRLIGYMPENNPIPMDLQVKEYLKFRGMLKGLKRDNLRRRIDFVVEQCRIDSVFNKLIGTLSKGYRQRVGLAETLLHDPQILILDEPTVGLDPAQIRQVRDLIRQIGTERTVILSTHILPEAEAACNCVIIINNGKIQVMDTVGNLNKIHRGAARLHLEIKNNISKFEQALSEFPDITLKKANPISDKHYSYFIESMDYDNVRETIFNTAVKTGCIILEMHREKIMLEDVFIKLVTQEKSE